MAAEEGGDVGRKPTAFGGSRCQMTTATTGHGDEKVEENI